MGIFIFAFSFLALKKFFAQIFLILSAVCAVLAWLVPNEIIKISGDSWACGLCSAAEHACRASTLPAVGVIVILIVCAAAIGIIFNFIKGSK